MTEMRPSGPPQIPTGAKLSSLRAVWNALLDRPVEFYPRVAEDGAVQSLRSTPVLEEAAGASKQWKDLADDETLNDAIRLARESLTEVSKQTEYQDQKATRLLTVTTFLSALAGVLFTRFQDTYPIGSLGNGFATAAIVITYLTFLAFVFTSLLGGLVVFHATRTRFKYPPFNKVSAEDAPPRSLIFHTGIIQARPRAWMNAWVGPVKDNSTAVQAGLRKIYFQNLVSESYLVAAKTADKLRYLQPAQNLLSIALRVLVVWLALLTVTSVFVTPTKPAAPPLEVRLSEPVALPAPNVVVELPASPVPPPARRTQ